MVLIIIDLIWKSAQYCIKLYLYILHFVFEWSFELLRSWYLKRKNINSLPEILHVLLYLDKTQGALECLLIDVGLCWRSPIHVYQNKLDQTQCFKYTNCYFTKGESVKFSHEVWFRKFNGKTKTCTCILMFKEKLMCKV